AHRGVPSDVSLDASAQRRRPPNEAPQRGRGRDRSRPAALDVLLRVRRDVCGEERRYIGRHGSRQARRRARIGGRGPGRRGYIVPDAHRRAPLAPALGRPGLASRRDPRVDRWRRMTLAPPDPSGPLRGRPEPTFRGTPPFPEAARAALADDQLRANLGRATATIRTKRAAAVAERADWEELRVAGAAI